MGLNFRLSCVFPLDKRIGDQTPEKGGPYSENNRGWLLAETAGGGDCGAAVNSAEPQSVHSSFRFSLLGLDSLGMNTAGAPATVLMVNLDSGLDESHSRELQWKKIESLQRSISPVASNLIRFSYPEILSATCNFSKGRVLGRGAFSCIFRGKVGFMRKVVAVKRLDMDNKESPKSFCRELMIASSLHNPHVVPLLGFCIDSDEGLFLVYKYVAGGSLERLLHGRKKGKKIPPVLPWSVRYHVAVGIGEATRYLHNGTEMCVVHRDIKPSNILISSKRKPLALLCDFGLASWIAAPSVPFLCKTVKGTFGYLSPEYFQHGKISDKTDVYAFGVVLLELLTGRKPIEAKRPSGKENLVQWAKPLLLLQKGSDAVQKLLDPRLNSILETCAKSCARFRLQKRA
ncbi:hypothetical protein SAY86_004455 [Trapa natans]|uniref:Protein kinase domain-containing protein n=1 Tax=Trapa natans TaxID=22666 RepID=A0AAN7N6M5_TRANT|nr:hypothetical protein SAY86_004455 [Trapa natans]